MHNHYSTRIGITAALLSALTSALPAHAVDVPPTHTGGIRLVVNQLSEKCLIPANGPGYRVTQAACDRSDRRQLWRFDGEHEDQQIVNTATGRCLTCFPPPTSSRSTPSPAA
ncbi:ricin-type beta-trefoil lectin domain protein [Actinoplanes philippinensis]|uniref:ricin-type beta-trefoil lectin domain protein n=1 Tax=Actinoplanes philippinensis TaxID=35752 RepID=UPI0033F91CCA